MSASEFLDRLDNKAVRRLRRLETEVGLNLYEYVGEFADALAFVNWWSPHGTADTDMTVYPATSVISQDASTLVTTATVTAIVECNDFATLKRSVDPQDWDRSSDVFTRARYVHGSYDLRPVKPDAVGHDRFLEEEVRVAWGMEEDAVGSFHNVLRIDLTGRDDPNEIDVGYRLARSIDSRILWDERPGGIVLDHGYLKVRPIADGRWRVTSRKTLLFSDRSPNAGWPGWLDFGQMLNHFAPAALSWWLESELYSAADPIYAKANGGR